MHSLLVMSLDCATVGSQNGSLFSGYDQLEGIRRSRPAFHHNLLRSLLLQLSDACGCFFRGCPVSNRPKWSLQHFTEPRILDFLLKLREEGKLLANADYNCCWFAGKEGLYCKGFTTCDFSM